MYGVWAINLGLGFLYGVTGNDGEPLHWSILPSMAISIFGTSYLKGEQAKAQYKTRHDDSYVPKGIEAVVQKYKPLKMILGPTTSKPRNDFEGPRHARSSEQIVAFTTNAGAFLLGSGIGQQIRHYF